MNYLIICDNKQPLNANEYHIDMECPENIATIFNDITYHITQHPKQPINIILKCHNKTNQFIIYSLINKLYDYKKNILHTLTPIKINGVPLLQLQTTPIYLYFIDALRINDTPSNIMNSTTISHYIQDNLPLNTTLQIFDQTKLQSMGFGGIIGINAGSAIPAQLLILHYQYPTGTGGQSSAPMIMIGKGVTYDVGGLNLKPRANKGMKTDKSGAVYVYTLIRALAHSQYRGHIIGFLPLVENVINSRALHPGDVVTLYDKTTVEITDTDAEGRVIIADCLSYITKNYKPSVIIDIATLTGSIAHFFGHLGTAIMTNRSGEPYIKPLQQIGDINLEYFWYVKLHRIYSKYLQSDVANISNHNSTCSADGIMAGMFLKTFVDERIPWIHLDIAGVVYKDRPTGQPLLSLFQFIQTLGVGLDKI